MNMQDIEFEIWYVCIKVITAPDPSVTKLWLKRLAQLTESLCQELISNKSLFNSLP